MSTFVYVTHKPTHIYMKCKRIHSKWGRLKMLISTTETKTLLIYSSSMKMVSQLLYIEMMKYINPDPVKKLGKNIYELSYEINNKDYKMVISPYRGPSPVTHIIDDYENDITELVLPYMGPNYDWYGHPVNPLLFNTSKLTISWSDGTTEELK
jgi:hypothetical protein